MAVQNYEKLIIINHDVLAYLPFETLMDENGSFLLENYQITYSTSLKLWDIQTALDDNHAVQVAVFSPKYELEFAALTTDVTIQNLVREG